MTRKKRTKNISLPNPASMQKRPTFHVLQSWLSRYHLPLHLHIVVDPLIESWRSRHRRWHLKLELAFATHVSYQFKLTERLLDVAVDGELTSGQGSNHEETSTETGEAALETELLGNLDQTAGGTFSGQTLCLVDLGEHSVGGLRDDSGSETGDDTGAQVVDGLHAVGGLALVDDRVDGLVDLLEDGELGHGVGHPNAVLVLCVFFARKYDYILLEQDGPETRVESTNTLSLENFAEAADKAVGEGGIRDETDAGGLERAEGDVSEELGNGGRSEVDDSAVLRGGLDADEVDGLLLEQLVSSELEGALEEVSSSGGAKSGEESAGALVGDDLPEATDHAIVVCDGVELHPRLDAGE
jgi:hypothetical protein